MDCSLWKEIVYGKEKYKMSYDCEDYLDCFLKRMERGEQLNKLDIHYYYQGVELDKGILKALEKFPNLTDLRFGEHIFTEQNYHLFKKLRFPKCKHMTTPLFKNKDEAKRFLDILKEVAPQVTSLTLKDPSFDKESFT